MVTPQGKLKSKHSNLLKREEKANKLGEQLQIQNKNDVTLSQFLFIGYNGPKLK